jgi:hypothetical protein
MEEYLRVRSVPDVHGVQGGFAVKGGLGQVFVEMVELEFRGAVLGIYGAPITAGVSGDDCDC